MKSAPATSSRRFRVAFSFAGEKRPFVKDVADLLAGCFSEEKILYDKYHEAEFSRARLGRYLPKLYHEQSDLVVIIISLEYSAKEWCALEYDAIFDLLKQRKDDEVMLANFDEATLEGLYSDAGFSKLDEKSPHDFATLILQRLARNENLPRDHYLPLLKKADPSEAAAATASALAQGPAVIGLAGGSPPQEASAPPRRSRIWLLLLAAAGMFLLFFWDDPSPPIPPSWEVVILDAEDKIYGEAKQDDETNVSVIATVLEDVVPAENIHAEQVTRRWSKLPWLVGLKPDIVIIQWQAFETPDIPGRDEMEFRTLLANLQDTPAEIIVYSRAEIKDPADTAQKYKEFPGLSERLEFFHAEDQRFDEPPNRQRLLDAFQRAQQRALQRK